MREFWVRQVRNEMDGHVVIEISSSSDSEDLQKQCDSAPCRVAKKYHELSLSSESDSEIPSLFDRLNKLKSSNSSRDQRPIPSKNNIRIEEVSTLPDLLNDFVDSNSTESNISSLKSSQGINLPTRNLYVCPATVDISNAVESRRSTATKRHREDAKAEKERQKALKAIDRERLKRSKPGECMNYVKAILDVRLLEVPETVNVTSTLQESNIRYTLEEQLVPNSVTWRREVVEQRLGDDLVETVTNVDEDQALILLTTDQFVEAVYQFTQERTGDTSSGQTLRELVGNFKSLLPGKLITIMTTGMVQYFRGQSRKGNREYRAKVLNCITAKQQKATRRKKQKTSNVISRIDVEEALVELQIEEHCNVRLLDTSADISRTIVMLTKSIAEAPYKLEKSKDGFVFFSCNANNKQTNVDKDGKGLLLLWQRQIQQFNSVSADVAQSIIAKYKSPLALYKAYLECEDKMECERLLKDIIVRRGAGPLATARKIGPELSRKVYIFMTSKFGSLTLD